MKKESAQQLRPIVLRLHRRLPFEIREQIYHYLFEDRAPKVVPVSEPCWLSFEREFDKSPREYTDLNPFRGGYLFSSAIVGDEISAEAREYSLRTTPLYFRGSQDPKDLEKFLDIRIAPYRALRDVIRHLRIYVRCEYMRRDLHLSIMGMSHGIWPDDDDVKRSGERQLYDSYSSRLSTLRTLPYALHSIRLEICVFHGLQNGNRDNVEHVKGSQRQRHNIMKAIKPIYFHAKKAGASIAVRFEDFHRGNGMDVTDELGRDATRWEQASTSILERHESWC